MNEVTLLDRSRLFKAGCRTGRSIRRPSQRCLMSKVLRGLAAGWGASKLGGGCLGTVVVFVLLWFVLGYFNIFQ